MKPTSYEFVKLAEQSYKNPNDRSINKGYVLPKGWKYFYSTNSEFYKDIYFAVVFKKNNKIVIASRGTNFDGDLRIDNHADLKDKVQLAHDIYNNFQLFMRVEPIKIKYAEIFVDSIIKDNPGAEIYFTGHSLGGLISQLLSVKFKSHATVFDSPGAKEIIEFNYAVKSKNLDITEYASQPNLINSVNTHVGPVKMLTNISCDISGADAKNFIKATYQTHAIKKIAQQFSKETGDANDVVNVKFWPEGYQEAYRFFSSYEKNQKFWDNFLIKQWKDKSEKTSKFNNYDEYKKHFIKENLITINKDIFSVVHEIEDIYNDRFDPENSALLRFLEKGDLDFEQDKKTFLKSANQYITGKVLNLFNKFVYDNLRDGVLEYVMSGEINDDDQEF